MQKLNIVNIEDAKNRIDKYIHKTPILSSLTLNKLLGHDLYFKAENLQKIGAFKIRGGINTVAWLVENNNRPKHIISNSSGNHAQAVALASRLFEIPSTIYMPMNVSKVKAQATKSYGAKIEFCESRVIADQKVLEMSNEDRFYWIPPFNHEQVICGQGTVAYEAFCELENINAIFAPCGGGGLLSGTLISTREVSPRTKIIAVEPQLANDAMRSFNSGVIQKLDSPPVTIADGARTMAVGDITFNYLQQLDDFYEAEEESIKYWTQWLTHLLKLQIEPTSAMAMVGVKKWLKSKSKKQRVLIILSGGNIDNETNKKIWEKDYLNILPSIENLL